MTRERILPAAGVSTVHDTRLAGTSAVVTFSGGQDSTTCLFYALKRYRRVHAITFDYGQRHRVELDCAAVIAGDVEAAYPERFTWTVVDVPAFQQFGDAALTNPRIAVEADASKIDGTGRRINDHAAARGLPSTFVPGRNLIFLGLAAAYGIPRGADIVVTGICGQDRAGYPDCRREFAEAFVDAVRLATDTPAFALDAPLLDRTKADTWQLAADLAITRLLVAETHTCYEGAHGGEFLHPWGHGCGECPACVERARGYSEWAERGV